jgi:hypothetical protein
MEMRMIALLLLAAQASIPVEVGRFDPANFPHAKLIDRRMPEAELVQRVDTIIAAKQCTLPGQTKDRYDIVVPYAVMMGANETESRIVVKDMSCPPIETLVGEVANALVKAGDFRKNPFGGERWYVSELAFAHGGEDLARTIKNDSRVICQEGHAKPGSRLGADRVCRTVAEWRALGIDRAQLQRDLTHNGSVVTDDGGKSGVRTQLGPIPTCTNPLRC